VNGYILNNDGQGKFTDVSKQIAPGLTKIGMIKDALWTDFDNDKDLDLLVIGDWMPIKIFANNQGKFTDITAAVGLTATQGWWNCIKAADLDKDGDMDYIVGNQGLNARFHATPTKPLKMYVNDFDQNGTVEQIITSYQGEQAYPLVLRHDLLTEIPQLKKKYLKYRSYANQTISDVFTPAQLQGALVLEAKYMETSLLINDGKGHLTLQALPIQAQFTPNYAIMIEDFDHDGNLDILLGGNLFAVKPEVGRYDASYGSWLRGDGKNHFIPVAAMDSGLKLEGQIRDFSTIKIRGKNKLLVARNNDSMQIFDWK
jgi:hypothetical protein